MLGMPCFQRKTNLTRFIVSFLMMDLKYRSQFILYLRSVDDSLSRECPSYRAWHLRDATRRDWEEIRLFFLYLSNFEAASLGLHFYLLSILCFCFVSPSLSICIFIAIAFRILLCSILSFEFESLLYGLKCSVSF
ncbi:hypothetical protein VNO78_07607 [Psophocarpus tetragonolobus]|uniref:Uncharacterized protein n=1 Tax=Psophocarpus tetragonolobus TaxID=3891 RepID=A0AAN9STC5_PSOTE